MRSKFKNFMQIEKLRVTSVMTISREANLIARFRVLVFRQFFSPVN